MYEFVARSPYLLRRILEHRFIRLEGGEFWSKSLRRMYKEAYNIEIGIGSYGCFNYHRFPSGTVIGNYCSFAGATYFLPRNHPLGYASQHPMFFNEKLGYIEVSPVGYAHLHVSDDVWVGQGALICHNCTEIGRGAIIGAGSVVTRNVEPYSIVAGNPAHVIRYRFDRETIELLEKSEWWYLPPEVLKNCCDVIHNPLKFVEKIEKFKGNIYE